MQRHGLGPGRARNAASQGAQCVHGSEPSGILATKNLLVPRMRALLVLLSLKLVDAPDNVDARFWYTEEVPVWKLVQLLAVLVILTVLPLRRWETTRYLTSRSRNSTANKRSTSHHGNASSSDDWSGVAHAAHTGQAARESNSKDSAVAETLSQT